jgi:hypothetical protein
MMPGDVVGLVRAALALVPEPDPVVRRARLIGRLARGVALLHRIRSVRGLGPRQAARLARWEAMLAVLEAGEDGDAVGGGADLAGSGDASGHGRARSP